MTDTCAPIRSELSALRARRRGQAELVEALPDNAGKEHAQDVLEGIDADIAAAEDELELCEARAEQAENPQDLAITGRVQSIVCHAASKEAFADQPYLLIASFDMANSVNQGVVGLIPPAVDVFKYGPWLGVNKGETHYASHLGSNPAFWDLDSDPRPIADPQDVIFLVAMCENDASSPDGIRGGVKSALILAHSTNTNQDYADYVRAMISNMTGTIETIRLEGMDPLHLNEDDLFGVKQLTLTTGDLDRLNNLETVAKPLRFTVRKANGKVKNDYTVNFEFTV
jgi:hypothetical protein